MILYTAKIVYGSADQVRKFYDFTNACKWLYSHAVGQMFINDVEYTRKTLKDSLIQKAKQTQEETQ